MVRFSTCSKHRIRTPLVSIGGIIVLLTSVFPFYYGTSFAQSNDKVTEEGGLLDLMNTNATGNMSNFTNATENITNITGQAVLVGTINLSSIAKSAPYSGPHVFEHERSPFPFQPSNVTQNDTFQLQVPFHFLNSSSLRQPVNQSTNNITVPFGINQSINSSSLKQSVNQSQIGEFNIVAGRAGIDQPTNQCGGCMPADVQIAVGEGVRETGYQYAVEMINTAVQIFGYPFGCTTVSCQPPFATFPPGTLRTFFNLSATNTDRIFDPRIIYDVNSHRFFAALTDATTNSVRVAVSASANPLGNWKVINVPFGNCPDQPTIGAARSVFAISVNLFSNNCTPGSSAFMGAQFILINKDDLVAGSSTPRLSLVANPASLTPADPPTKPTSNAFAVRVVEDTHEPLKLVGTEPFNGKSYALIYQYSNYQGGCVENEGCYQVNCGPSPNPNIFLPLNVCPVEIETPNTPALADQPGTNINLDTGDNRITSASAAGNPRILVPSRDTGGSLWFAYNEGCDTEIDANSCFHLVKLRSETKTAGFDSHQFTRTIYKVHQDRPFTAAPNDVFYPALKVDRDQNLAVIFGTSSSSQFPSLAVSRQDYTPGAPPSEPLQPPATVVTGTSSDTSNSAQVGTPPPCTQCSRYGDYFGAAANPAERNWWLAGQWMTSDASGNAFYSTWIVPYFVRP
jgi:hypothetical protein